MSRPFRTSSATGRVPVCANSQSPRMTPAAACGLRPADRDRRQAHLDPPLPEDTGLGAEPRRVLPCREQARGHPDLPGRVLRGGRAEGDRRGRTGYESQELSSQRRYGLLRIRLYHRKIAAFGLGAAGGRCGLGGTPRWLLA